MKKQQSQKTNQCLLSGPLSGTSTAVEDLFVTRKTRKLSPALRDPLFCRLKITSPKPSRTVGSNGEKS